MTATTFSQIWFDREGKSIENCKKTRRQIYETLPAQKDRTLLLGTLHL